MRWTLPLLLVLAACGPRQASLPAGATADVVGTVVSVDASPMAYDGDALVRVQTDVGLVTIHIPARMNLCEAEGLAAFGDLQAGVRVEVRGAVSDEGDVTPCTQPDHYLRIVA